MPSLCYDREAGLAAGRKLAHPPPGEEVVISGTSGMFPETDNVTDFAENLFNKIDLITSDDRRWKLAHPEIPQRTGKLNCISKFDAAFFGIHYKQAQSMDPMCRILLEKAYEAILDAGYNPRSFHGSNTGVFVGACFSESEKTWLYEKLQVNGFGLTGCTRAMLSNRISYWLGADGPSYTLDSACSSSLYAFEHGYRAIRDGLCDAAIIGGCNLCLHPYVSLQFARLGVLSMDGKCKCFDEAANGYCRSEAISVVILQKRKDARRVYGTVIHAKTNCDGYKEEGITYPSGAAQKLLLDDFYEECQIDPASLDWVEAHGTGTKVGDPEELRAIQSVFCKNRKTPLKIGSVKSNIGHSEPASGLCSVTKTIIAMETGFIPPNINYITPRADCPQLTDGSIEVVTEKTPVDGGGLVGINSFGFGGANCHVLLRWNEKIKLNNGSPRDNLPRLVNISGRTKESVHTMLSYLETHPLDADYVKLYHEINKEKTPGHLYRGYTILSKNKTNPIRDIQYFPRKERPLWYVFSSIGSEWAGMGHALMEYKVFAATITKLASALKPYNIELWGIINDPQLDLKESPLCSIIGLTAMQIGLIDLLASTGLVPDGIIGESVGEIACAYADGSLTAEEAVLLSYHIGMCLKEANHNDGSMMILGLCHAELKKICPQDIDIISTYRENCTISGSKKSLTELIKKLKAKNISYNLLSTKISLNSRFIASSGPKLLKTLQKVISQPKVRSTKWISTSVKEVDWKSPLSLKASAEYMCHSIMNPIYTNDVLHHIPKDVIAVEIAPHEILNPILQKTFNRGSFISLMDNSVKGHSHFFLSALGKIFMNGGNLDLSALYPEVTYPVPRSTPMISPLIRWEHSEDWYVTSYRLQGKIKSGERTVQVSLKEDEFEYISGHVIDGRTLFPATGYLALAWETLGLMRGELYTEIPVVFENVRFLRATNVPKDGNTEFIVMVQKGNGNFEIVEGGAAIVTGRIYIPEDINLEVSRARQPNLPTPTPDMIDLNSRDIYKELRLRGYNYKGLFRSLVYSDITGSVGRVQWQNNWVAFMDNILQMLLLHKDSRGLFVPTCIQKLVVDVKKHVEILQSLPEDNKELPAYVYKDIGLVCCGGVEARGLQASAISRKKPIGEPVLEKHLFLPYISSKEMLQTPEVVRSFVHIALENTPGLNIKMVELVDSETNPNGPLLAPIIVQTLGDLPLIQQDISVLANPENPLLTNIGSEIAIEDKQLANDQSALIVAASNVLDDSRAEVLESCLGAVKEGGFILTREKMNATVSHKDIILYSRIACSGEDFILLRKAKKNTMNSKIIRVTGNELSWMSELKEIIKSKENVRVFLVSENDIHSGLLGFAGCITKEPDCEKIRSVFIMDKNAPTFSLDNPFYSEQLDKDLLVNIYKDGEWGSYRHLPLEDNSTIKCFHAYVNVATRGDLSSLTWFQGPIKSPDQASTNFQLVNIHYSALNFRDIMTATGRIPPEVVSEGRLELECVQGLEYSGINKKGERVMGMQGSKGLASVVAAKPYLTWLIPDGWTLEDGATVPIAYGTVIYSLKMVGKMEPGETVLIHSGTGGVGLAAINYCFHYGCKVFTTVGTQEKREFIKKQFPQLTDRHIGNSRDTSFEQLIMKETNGRGVDLVLNSLAEEKLLASIRCLAYGGRFLEIGKFDLTNNNPIGMEEFLKEISFHGIMLDKVFTESNIKNQKLHDAMNEALCDGAVRPIPRTVFEDDKIEQAFRYMAAGRHIGKVLIKIKEEPEENSTEPQYEERDARPTFYCSPEKSYVVAGGLGGFGLELADWLVLRGCKKLILSSRTGLRTGYQSMRLMIWRSYGIDVKISTKDITTSEGVEGILNEANAMGPVGGIFNLAVVLKDAIFLNQTEDTFMESLKPKAFATEFFDKHSRILCPELDEFVVFSSVSCGRGNPGQTNYGMSNSIMERICEERVAQGLPGLAVQWGAVGDVGLVAEKQEDDIEVVIGGTLQQRISSCLQMLDRFIKQKHPVVASMVVAEKKLGAGVAENIVDTVANILGLRDLRTVSLHSTLAELGMDSMMAVEIKQTLEREFEVFLTPQDIRSMTFAKLEEISKSSKESTEKQGDTGLVNGDSDELNILNYLLQVIGEEKASSYPILRLPTLYNSSCVTDDISMNSNKLILLPGIEGVASVMEPLCKNLNYPAVCLQYDYKNMYDSVQSMTERLIPLIKEQLPPSGHFNIVGYSYGGLVAIEVATILEKQGYQGNLWFIDSSPKFLPEITKLGFKSELNGGFETELLGRFIEMLAPQEKPTLLSLLEGITDWESKIDALSKALPLDDRYSMEYRKSMMNAIYNRMISTSNYVKLAEEQLLRSSAVLIRPSILVLADIENDYALSEYFTNPVDVHFIDGNHVSIMENPKTAELINNTINIKNDVIFKKPLINDPEGMRKEDLVKQI